MKFLVIDVGGMHVATARKLGKEGHQVYYWVAWQSAYPNYQAFSPGEGCPEITKVLDWGMFVDRVDCIVFPDSGMGGVAHMLRKQGYNVFGMGKAEETEFNRMKAIRIQDDLGMKRPPTWRVEGFDAALAKIEKLLGKRETNQLADGKYFVKFNVWRGSLESFPVESWQQTKMLFDSVRGNIGPYADSIPVIIQEKIEGIECGGDIIVCDGRPISGGLLGFESGANYVARVVEDYAFHNDDVDKICSYFKNVGANGFFSWECIYDGSDTYIIDFTPRSGLPLGLMYAQFIENYGELLYKVSTGEAEESGLQIGKYIACAEISSEEAITKFIALTGNEHTQWMRHMMTENGDTFACPGASCVGIICGSGDSLEEVSSSLEQNSEGVSAYFGSFDVDFVEATREKYIEPLKEFGFDFEE